MTGGFVGLRVVEDDERGRTYGSVHCEATGGLVGLRVIENNKRRADRFAVRSFEFHAADATGQTGDLDDRAAGLAAGNRWQHDLFRCPADLRAFALKELAVGAVGDSVESLDRKTDFGIVGQQ